MLRATTCLGGILLAWSVTLAGGSGDSLQSTRAVTLPADVPVRIHVDVGSVRVTGSTRPDVVVRIERRATGTAGLDALQERVDVTDAGLNISVTSRDRPHDAALTAAVHVELPAGQPLDNIELFEGAVHVAGLTGPVRATVTRGTIEASEVSGRLRLETSMGTIAVRHSRATLTNPIRLRTFNGDIDLVLPAAVPNARILALALNGTVTSEVPLTERTVVGPRFREATRGSGDPVVSLDAVNGSIRIASRAR